MDASITRGSNTYGTNQYPEKFIPLFITNMLDGEPLPLYGDGKQVRDWLHVEDHCAGIELVLKGGPGESTTSAARNERFNIDVANTLFELTGADRSLLRRVDDRPGHDRRYSIETVEAAGARLGAARAVRGRASGRPSTGTATTAPGGSRSSPASTASTTSASTARGSAPPRLLHRVA